MTRINLVPVEDLCDQHILAELRELPRIPNSVISGRLYPANIPEKFCLGKGHVKFFSNKLLFLENRHRKLYEECLHRGFNVQNFFPHNMLRLKLLDHLLNDYEPTAEDIALSAARIAEKIPKTPRYYGRYHEF